MSRRHTAGKVVYHHSSPLVPSSPPSTLSNRANNRMGTGSPIVVASDTTNTIISSPPLSASTSNIRQTPTNLRLVTTTKDDHHTRTNTVNNNSSDHHRRDHNLSDYDNHNHNDIISNDGEQRSLTLQVVDGVVRHTNIPCLTCAFLAALTTGGTTYAFGLYGDSLKKSLHLTQPQLDTISTANFCAGMFSWIPGLIVDTFGTRMGLAAGGIQGAVSLSLYWCVATQWYVVERQFLVPTLSLLGVSIFLSCALITGSVFKIIVSTCGPGSKGAAVGAAKGYVGLGAGVYACMFNSLRYKGESDLDFLPMAAFFFLVCVTIPSLFLMPTHHTMTTEIFHDESTPFHFRTLYCSLLAMAALIVFNSLMELYNDDDDNNNRNNTTTITTLLSNGGDILEQPDDHDGPNIPMALFLVTIWMGPILALQLLPRKSTLEDLPDDNDDEEENESLLLQPNTGTPNDLVGELPGGEISMQRMRKAKGSGSKNNSASSGLIVDFSAAAAAAGASGDFLRLPHHDTDKDNLNNPLNASFSDHVAAAVLSIDGGDDEQLDNNRDSDDQEENQNLWQMIQTPAAWLMLWTTTILVGGGIVETNNMGQMVEALRFPRDTTSASLAFFSVAQAGGRVITGALSESALYWPTKKFCIEEGIPRTFFFVVASIAGFIAHFILSFATSKGMFVIGTTLAGLAFGMVWPMMVLVVGEVFGTANVGANYMFFDGFTSAAGSLLLSKFVAQEIYEEHVDRTKDPDNVTCLGSECFSMTHMAVAVLSLICIATSLCLVYKTRHIYTKQSLHKGH